MKSLWIIIITLTLAGCSEPPPKTLSGIKGVIQLNDPKFSAGPGTMTIDIEANATMVSFTNKADKVLRDIKQYFPDELNKYKKVWIFGTTKLVDRYGNKFSERTVGIEWSTEELKKANLSSNTFTTWQVLNLASEVRGFQGVGHDMFLAYCNEEVHQKYAEPFCALYVLKYR